MLVAECLFAKACQLSGDGNRVPYLAAVQHLFTKFTDVVFDIIDVNTIFVIQSSDPGREVSPNFFSLNLAKIVVVKR